MTTNRKISLILGIAIIVVAGGTAFLQNMPAKSDTSADPSPIVAPAATSTSTSVSYSMAVVALHKNRASCWTAINGGVYDVTSWINQHPGGQAAILSLCGTDGSAAFNGQHSGERRPEAELASFKIGSLSQ